jgi:hypothetical protein
MGACSQVKTRLHLTILDENGGITCLENSASERDISPLIEKVEIYLTEGHCGPRTPGWRHNLLENGTGVTSLALRARFSARRDSDD